MGPSSHCTRKQKFNHHQDDKDSEDDDDGGDDDDDDDDDDSLLNWQSSRLGPMQIMLMPAYLSQPQPDQM